MAQELLSTFEDEITKLVLIPDASGGVFEIRIDGALVWSREEEGGFPEIKQLKILVRDRVSPQKNLGHIEK
jgi:selenoprotein W-related protein